MFRVLSLCCFIKVERSELLVAGGLLMGTIGLMEKRRRACALCIVFVKPSRSGVSALGLLNYS